MPTISPAWTSSVSSSTAGWPTIVGDASGLDLQHAACPARAARASTAARVSRWPTIISAMASLSSSAVGRVPTSLPRRSTVTVVGEGIHLAELVRDDQTMVRHPVLGQLLAAGRSTSSASAGVSTEVGSSRISSVPLEVELAQDLALLLLAGGERRRPARRAARGTASSRGTPRARALGSPSRSRRARARATARSSPHRHVRHQGEVLVDHADARARAPGADGRS